MNEYRSICGRYCYGVFLNYIRVYLGPSWYTMENRRAFPMGNMPEMIEPTFAKLIKEIRASTELPEQTKAQWCSALRGLARCFNLPPESIPARYSAGPRPHVGVALSSIRLD